LDSQSLQSQAGLAVAVGAVVVVEQVQVELAQVEQEGMELRGLRELLGHPDLADREARRDMYHSLQAAVLDRVVEVEGTEQKGTTGNQ
jgi:hypothetical protein